MDYLLEICELKKLVISRPLPPPRSSRVHQSSSMPIIAVDLANAFFVYGFANLFQQFLKRMLGGHVTAWGQKRL
jgi:hypothetical protein